MNSHYTAFPSGEDMTPGLTKREYFVAMAMHAIISRESSKRQDDGDIAMKAIELADETLGLLED